MLLSQVTWLLRSFARNAWKGRCPAARHWVVHHVCFPCIRHFEIQLTCLPAAQSPEGTWIPCSVTAPSNFSSSGGKAAVRTRIQCTFTADLAATGRQAPITRVRSTETPGFVPGRVLACWMSAPVAALKPDLHLWDQLTLREVEAPDPSRARKCIRSKEASTGVSEPAGCSPGQACGASNKPSQHRTCTASQGNAEAQPQAHVAFEPANPSRRDERLEEEDHRLSTHPESDASQWTARRVGSMAARLLRDVVVPGPDISGDTDNAKP